MITGTHKGRCDTLRSGDEFDAISRYWRGCLHWKRGEIKRIKRRINKRCRKQAGINLRMEITGI